MRLHGQVAIVTGAGSGIGQAAAVALAAEGASVALVGRNPATLAQTAALLPPSAPGAADALCAALDVRDRDAVERFLASVVDRFGRLDVLVNSAGVNVPQRDMGSLATEDWDLIVGANLTGTFLMSRAALPAMRAQRSGTIVNISSLAGYRPSTLTGPAYNAAKAGVNAFTESLNQAERTHGIRACALCPGEVATPILEKRPQPPTAEARALMLTPEDVAQAIVFVATLPPRAMVELLILLPTAERDWSAELG